MVVVEINQRLRRKSLVVNRRWRWMMQRGDGVPPKWRFSLAEVDVDDVDYD